MSRYQHGVCLPGKAYDGDPAKGIGLACDEIIRAGYDYAEASMVSVMKFSEAVFSDVVREGLPIKSCNCFLPSELKITSDTALITGSPLTEYVKKALDRAKRLGVEVIVFGSGGSRRIPNGMKKDEGLEYILRFLQFCSPIAESHDVIIAIEPLRESECNAINFTGEAESLAEKAGNGISYIADTFHMYFGGEPADALVSVMKPPAHVHIAEPPSRMYPGAEGGEYLRGFADALKNTTFSGRITVECSFKDFDSEIIKAKRFMDQVF